MIEFEKTEPSARPPSSLAKLLHTRRDELGGKSYRAIATEAGLSVAAVHKIFSGKLKGVPAQRTITGLSRALQVPEQSLLEAAAADMGLREFEVIEGSRRAIYLATEDLDDEQRALVLNMINALRSANET